MGSGMRDRKILFVFLIYLVCLGLALSTGVSLFQRSLYIELDQKVKNEAENVSTYFNKELARYAHIPELLTNHYQIRQLLQFKTGEEELNLLLLDTAKTTGASEVYVLDIKGDVVAASNFQNPSSFIGGNFSFRPYFQQAIKGQNSTYYALGVRSKERGIFFSSPVYVDEKIIGVAAVKVDISRFEQDTEWLSGQHSTKFMVYGPDNVIFMSNHPFWRLKQLSESEVLSWTQIKESQRYLDLTQNILNNSKRKYALADLQQWQIDYAEAEQGLYFYGESSLPSMSLKLVTFSPAATVGYQVTNFMIWLSLGYSVVFVLAFYLYRRFAGYRQLLYTRRALEKEISVRTHELDKAHKALMQSTKLATIGQMSASINHEINQPLSAMNAYIAACRRLLDRGDYQQAKETLNTIQDMTERVHRIVSQLKQFSRNKEPSLAWCEWSKCLDAALVVVGPQITNYKVDLSVEHYSSFVWGEALKLEQVLVNLLSNAIDAMSEQQEKSISISFSQREGYVDIHITDSGIGLDLQNIDTIFDAFFTTKSDQGLGLGLSISRNIIRSFDGELTAKNGGLWAWAKFTISLKSSNTGNN